MIYFWKHRSSLNCESLPVLKMGNTESISTFVADNLKPKQNIDKIIKLIPNLVEVNRDDLVAELIKPYIDDISFDTLCKILSAQSLPSSIADRLLKEYKPVTPPVPRVPEHLSALFRYTELLKCVQLTDDVLVSTFEYIADMPREGNLFSVVFDDIIRTNAGKLTKNELNDKIYAFLSCIPPEQLTRVEDLSTISRFELVSLRYQDMEKFRDLAPLSTISGRHWERLERKYKTQCEEEARKKGEMRRIFGLPQIEAVEEQTSHVDKSSVS